MDLERTGCKRVDWLVCEQAASNSRVLAEALQALVTATTERTSRILLDQYHGALDRALDALLIALERSDLAAAQQIIDELLRWQSLGQHLTRPWRVVLAGAPNVGKSSLINALVGYQRTVVDAVPGTTRDVVGVTTALDGWPVELSDTAGVRSTDDPLEAQGVARALDQLEQADLIVLVIDATHQDRPLPPQVASLIATAPVLQVQNKCDLRVDTADSAAGAPAHLRTSALTGEGLPALIDAISAQLVPQCPPSGTPIPFFPTQIHLLHELKTMLDHGDTRSASDQLAAWRKTGFG
jgi:tRNA modification GTPase